MRITEGRGNPDYAGASSVPARSNTARDGLVSDEMMAAPHGLTRTRAPRAARPSPPAGLVLLPARRRRRTWPRSSTCACASSRARWRPSWCSRSRSASTHRPSGWSPGRAAWACCCWTASSPWRCRSATGPPPNSRAPAISCRRRRRPATTCSSTSRPGTSSSRRASPCSTPASPSACGRGRRSPWPSCVARASAPRTSTCSAPSPASHGWRSAWRWCCGTSPRAGARSSWAASACRSRSPTGCSGSSSGAERPSVSHALARLAEAELVTGRGDEWHLHGSLDHHLACFAERGHPVSPQTAAAVRAPARA